MKINIVYQKDILKDKIEKGKDFKNEISCCHNQAEKVVFCKDIHCQWGKRSNMCKLPLKQSVNIY